MLTTATGKTVIERDKQLEALVRATRRIDHLRHLLIRCGRSAGALVSDNASDEVLEWIPDRVRARVAGTTVELTSSADVDFFDYFSEARTVCNDLEFATEPAAEARQLEQDIELAHEEFVKSYITVRRRMSAVEPARGPAAERALGFARITARLKCELHELKERIRNSA